MTMLNAILRGLGVVAVVNAQSQLITDLQLEGANSEIRMDVGVASGPFFKLYSPFLVLFPYSKLYRVNFNRSGPDCRRRPKIARVEIAFICRHRKTQAARYIAADRSAD